jgi:hypothetical protein
VLEEVTLKRFFVDNVIVASATPFYQTPSHMNYINIIKTDNHISLQPIALHMTLEFHILDWDSHENEMGLMDRTVSGSMNARS